VDSLEQVIAKERKITKDKVIELEEEVLAMNKEKTNALDELSKNHQSIFLKWHFTANFLYTR